jgi:hypothetical protein
MNFLDALHYYFFAGLEAILDFPHWAETITDFYGSNARLIVTSAAYHSFPKHSHDSEMLCGSPDRMKAALKTSDTAH